MWQQIWETTQIHEHIRPFAALMKELRIDNEPDLMGFAHLRQTHHRVAGRCGCRRRYGVAVQRRTTPDSEIASEMTGNGRNIALVHDSCRNDVLFSIQWQRHLACMRFMRSFIMLYHVVYYAERSRTIQEKSRNTQQQQMSTSIKQNVIYRKQITRQHPCDQKLAR